jgi:ATP-dependent protease ClpP protease subunit
VSKKKSEYKQIEIHTKEENFSLISNKKNNYDLYVGEFDNAELGHNMILNKLSQLEKKDTLNIHISSIGGDARLLLSYINILQKTTATVNGYLNFGYSAGALLFGACHNRYVYTYSSLMYHTFSQGVYGKSQEVQSNLSCSLKVVHNMMGKFYLGINEKEFNQLKDGKDFWFDADEIVDRKIAVMI